VYNYIKGGGTLAYYLTLAYFAYLMALITLQYVPINFNVAFLRLKEAELSRPYYQWAFFGHVYTSIFVLLAGMSQFSTTVRSRWPLAHRNLGMVYVGLILLVAAPTGLVMGIHANGGPWSQLSFCLQALLWFGFTWRALQLARQRNWPGHRAFMLRSYALTLSAVTLRLWKWGIVTVFAPPPMDTYRLVAWLGWLGNLLLVEWWLWRTSDD
jgi:hypothetical protein